MTQTQQALARRAEQPLDNSSTRPGALGERIAYARALAAANLLPKAYRDQPANVLLAMEYADALGLRPMAVIQNLHIIEGKPSASAELIGALVRRAGHRLRVHLEKPGTPEAVAIAEIVRSDDPEYVFTALWSLPRAKQAGLLGKDNWQHYPEQMLKRRATSEAARDACPEVLSGLYEHDETDVMTWPSYDDTAPLVVDEPTGEITEPEAT